MKHLIAAFILIGMLSAAEKPIFYIPFDEGAGDRAKDVVNDIPVRAAKWAPNGKSRAAALLDGTPGTVIAVEIPKALSFGMNDVTVSFWANPSAVTFDDLKDKRRRMIGIVDNYPVVWGVIDLREGGVVSLEFGRKKDGGPTAGTSFSSSGKIKPNEWSHIALVVNRQAKKLLLYINGTLDTEKPLNPDFDAPLTADRPFTVGSTWQNFIGMIDDVRAYPCALTADELDQRREKFFTGTLSVSGVERVIEIKTRTENVKDASTYYVSAAGNDDWTGTAAAPNAAKTDGPFATVNGALAMIRGVKAQGKYNKPVTVIIKNGTYRMTQPITLVPGDGGTKEYPLLIRAEESGKVELSGGRRIDGWKKNGDLWQTEIDDVKEGNWYFHALFINDKRAVRSRHPNTGFFRAANFEKENKKEFYFKPGDVLAWDNIADINVWVYHSWTASFHSLESVDMEKNKITVRNPSSYPFGKWGDARFYFENIREALDQPGEWYLDRKSGVLSYLPIPGEDITKAEVIAPDISRLVDVKGEPKDDKYIEYIGFQGIVFSHVDRDLKPTDVVDGQAFVNVRKAMVFAQGLRNASFEKCQFLHGNVHAVWLEKGCFDVRIQQCHIYDHGGGGVYIGDTTLHADQKQRTERITVDNCYMHALNLIMHGAHGVWIGKSSYNRISHNEICDLDYSPIGAGWSWGYAASSANNNVFEYNHLHHYGLGELSDMAGIYTLGISPGTVMRYNLVHDASSYSYGGWGLYTDEGSSEVLIEKNIAYNTKSGGFHQHYGSNNLVRNNIFAFAAEGNVISKRADTQGPKMNASFIFEKNIVITTNGFMIDKGFRTKLFRFDNNLYWDIIDSGVSNMSFNGYTFQEWREEEGFDKSSIIADPLFVDARKFDFRFKPGSPAAKIGFVPFMDEIAKAGLYGDAAWKALPKQFTPREANTDMKPPSRKKEIGNRLNFREDFEAIAPGVPPPFGNADPGILVTGEQAKSGYSLKFQDDSGLANEWRPHLSFNNKFLPGRISGSLDVFLEDGAIFWNEWRDNDGPYKVGPTIKILADGSFMAGTVRVMDVPRKKWIHIEIEAVTGSGTWDLAVTVDGESRREFSSLKNGNAAWASLDAVIWSAMAETRTAFYMDNIIFKVTKQ